MNTQQVAEKLVELCNNNQSDAVVDELYADNIVSVEPMFDAAAGETGIAEGITAIREKHAWWEANHEVHRSRAEGPYMGQRDNEFMVKFIIDVTPRGASKVHLEELAHYTVADGRIVREEFLQVR